MNSNAKKEQDPIMDPTAPTAVTPYSFKQGAITVFHKTKSAAGWCFTFFIFVGGPVFIQLRNFGFYQWIMRNGGLKRESLSLLGMRPY